MAALTACKIPRFCPKKRSLSIASWIFSHDARSSFGVLENSPILLFLSMRYLKVSGRIRPIPVTHISYSFFSVATTVMGSDGLRPPRDSGGYGNRKFPELLETLQVSIRANPPLGLALVVTCRNVFIHCNCWMAYGWGLQSI